MFIELYVNGLGIMLKIFLEYFCHQNSGRCRINYSMLLKKKRQTLIFKNVEEWTYKKKKKLKYLIKNNDYTAFKAA